MKKIYNVTNELLDRHVISRGDKVAIYYGQEAVSYLRLQEMTNRFGNALKELGVERGARIILALPDCPEAVYGFLGAIKYGAWPVPISPLLSESTYQFLLDDSQAMVLLTSKECAAKQARSNHLRHILCVDDDSFTTLLHQASVELDPYPSSAEDIAFMLYSSGSTGNPKGVPHRHGDIPFTADTYGKHVLNMSEEDIVFSASKLFFAYGLGNSISFPLRFGAAVILYPGKSTAPEILRVVSTYKPTLFFGVPTLFNLLLKTMSDAVAFDSVRLCVSAGEALPAGAYDDWKKLTNLDILDGIGSTEALHIFISNRPGEVRPGTSGSLVPPWEAKIIGDDGQLAAAGVPGHLLIRGKSTAPFYWNRPDKTAETMLADGWLKTGDIYMEEAGCFRYLGRADDMFKVDANWVSPTQVEHAMREHPAVMECGVSWRTLEGLVKPLAYVVLNPGFLGGMKLVREMRAHILQRLPEYMCPVQIEFCSEIPKTETGKLQRFKLRTDK